MDTITSRKQRLLAACVALIVSFTLFSNSLKGDFVFDDTIVVVGNPLITGGLPNVGEIFSTSYHAYQPRTGLYRPLTILSFSTNAFIFGFSSLSFHVVNVLLYALSAFLLFLFIKNLAGFRAAWIGLVFFLLMPTHAEAVASIVGRAELLSLIFALAALLDFKSGKFWRSGIWLLAGLLSKEVAVAALPVMLVMHWNSGKFQWRRFLQEFAPAALFTLVYLFLRWNALGGYFLANDATTVYNPIKTAPFWQGLWTTMKVFVVSLGKLLVPTSYSSDYSFNQIPLVPRFFSSWQAVAGTLSVMVLSWLAFLKRKSATGIGLLLFLSGYFVISNWIFKIGTITGERLLFLSSAGFALALGVFVSELWGQDKKWLKATLLTVAALAIPVYAWASTQRSGLWLNSKTLFTHAYATAPNSVVNITNRAFLDFEQNKFEDARTLLERALLMAPEHPPTLNLMAYTMRRLGDYRTSEATWKRAIQARKDYLNAYLGLGTLYYEAGYYTSAERVLADAIVIYPRWNEVWYLSLTKLALGKTDESISLIEEKFSASPKQEELRFALALAWYAKGDVAKSSVYAKDVTSPNLRSELERNIKPADRVKILGN